MFKNLLTLTKRGHGFKWFQAVFVQRAASKRSHLVSKAPLRCTSGGVAEPVRVAVPRRARLTMPRQTRA